MKLHAVVLVDQQPAEPRAVDEEIAPDVAVLAGFQRGDESSLVTLHADDVIDDAFHTAAERNLPQIPPEEDGIKVIGIVEKPLILLAFRGLRRTQMVRNKRGWTR